MDVPSQTSRLSLGKSVEEYSNLQHLISDEETLKNENLYFSLKIEIFERYLRKKCPSVLVAGTDKLEQALFRRSNLFALTSPRSSSNTPVSGHSPSIVSSSSHLGAHSHSGGVHVSLRICPLYKMDMVDRELDEQRIAMDKLRRRFQSARFLLETEEENFRSDIILLRENKHALEVFIKHNVDKKTGRVLHAKFVKFMESQIQNGERDLRKLNLKTKSSQIEYNRLMARHEQRLELKERVHPVDLDRLHIEDEELQQKLQHKTKCLMELKKVVGKKGQNLVLMKSKLNDTLLSLRSLKHDIKQKETKYKFTEEKEIENVNELITAEIINQNIKKLTKTYKSPDTQNYLLLQVRLSELRSEREVWERRCKYQRQTISLLEHQLKQLSPPQRKSKGASSLSYSRTRSQFSSKSADSVFRSFTRSAHAIPHCTPTTPIVRQW